MSLHELAKDKFGIPAKGSEMNLEFAECGYQSGPRFPDHSAPRLIRNVAPCETASAGGVNPLPAGKDELSLDARQGPAVSSLVAHPCSSLRKILIQRDTPKWALLYRERLHGTHTRRYRALTERS